MGEVYRARALFAVLAASAAFFAVASAPAQTPAPDVERWRPWIHFTPPRGFMNDPNGLVYADGEYHLFYQHNPFGTRWGHMSWGHAVSSDLMRWRDLPVALREAGGWMIFSGSAVARPGNAGLAAIYTAHSPDRQVQHVAWSADRGRTWTPDASNPILDLGLKDFRDPKVIWYEPASEWIMVVAIPDRRLVRFFGSKDLRAWAPRGAFGPAGSTVGVWECPDLVRVPVEDGAPGDHRDVLMVSVGEGAPAGGSGVQYFVGEFDGRGFTPGAPGNRPRWVDYGPDFYAGQSWANLPDATERAVWIGWMSNWRYANDEPSGRPERAIAQPSDADWRSVMTGPEPRGPWRGAMSIPRELALQRRQGEWRLVQRPVREIVSLRTDETADVRVTSAAPAPAVMIASAADLDLAITLGSARSAGLVLAGADGREIRVGIDRDGPRVFVDRRRSGTVVFHPAFASRDSAPVGAAAPFRLRLLVDRSSLEVFADTGATVLTSRIFPAGTTRELRTFIERGGGAVDVRGWRLQTSISR